MPGRDDQDNNHSLGADVGTIVMAGAAAATVNEALKAVESEHNRGEHLLHAGLGAAAVGAGFEMVRRATTEDSDGDDNEHFHHHNHHHHYCHHHHDDYDCQCRHTTVVLDKDYCYRHGQTHRPASVCSDHGRGEQEAHHHKLHLAEETIGAWGLVKNALGDKKHKKIHAAEEVLGAVGLLGEAKAHRHHHD